MTKITDLWRLDVVKQSERMIAKSSVNSPA